MADQSLIYRCAYVISGRPVMWDNNMYIKKKHAYNRLKVVAEEKNYKQELNKGAWEVMHNSGWYRDNGKYNAKVKAYEWSFEYD